MDSQSFIRTVLGKRSISADTVFLPHEHICCYSEYLNAMSKSYLDKSLLAKASADILKNMKEKYGVGVFVDCTPPSLGRDTELLKKVAELSDVEIICSTGFYYNDEPILNCASAETLAEYLIEDARLICAGLIKSAVEYEEISDFNIKLLRATALAEKKTGLPIVLHTNARNRNAEKAVDILLCEGVRPEKIIVGHLSDTDDNEYIKRFAELGCYVALDRIYGCETDEYVMSKVKQINALCDFGHSDKLLLSHDDSVFQGFCDKPSIKRRGGIVYLNISPRGLIRALQRKYYVKIHETYFAKNKENSNGIRRKNTFLRCRTP